MDWLQDDVVKKQAKKTVEPWRILVVDDDQAVHEVTRLAMSRFEFEQRPVHLESVYSAAEAKEKLQGNNRYALILLDVVMETEHAGLELARYIRHHLHNTYSRIILRTGQPGVAPERNVIRDYDIDGYKAKSQLQRQDLELVFYTSLRAYRDICMLQNHRQNLERLIRAIATISQIGDLVEFTSVVMEELKLVLNMSSANLYIDAPKVFAVCQLDEKLQMVEGEGTSVQLFTGKGIESIPKQHQEYFQQAKQSKQHIIGDGHYVYFHHSEKGLDSILAFQSSQPVNKSAQQLINLFLGNVVLTFENLLLANSFEETQQLAISLMGGAMESRSKETGSHVVRVGLYAKLLAELSNQNQVYCDKISLAAQLHDVGKVGVPDMILNKPGKLEGEEWEIMKQHTIKGWEILKDTGNPIIDMAANIAIDHHERWDGNGYPHAKKQQVISLEGRITAIADVFDALCCRRCYKEPWTMEAARAEIIKGAGTHFDPELVRLFELHFDDFKQIYLDRPE
ncbi:HD domain-containing phosphohydrolase [Pseudoalteromonas mariniglutinosa]|uniref:HD domain-containing phosphohydrolase n=1 Tax=Pseudoalteromonas mariniglutinosa TaxID=206042 RepID=UPI003851275D